MTMQRLIIAVACAGACNAFAQSSVTLTGIADAGVRSVSNEGRPSNKSLISGGNNTSRIILSGLEDLGGGLSARFHLEHGLLLNSGAQASSVAGQFWDRRSTVSLSSKAWGEIRAGRDFVPTYRNWSPFDPFSVVGVASANNLVSASPVGPIRAGFGSNPNTTVRSNDAVQWLLPSVLGGLEGGLMASADAGPVAQGKNKVVGARLGWAAGPARVSAATMSTENDLTTVGKLKDHAIAGAYDFGVMQLTAAWRRFDYADARQTNLLLGLVAPVFGVGQVKASWGKVSFDGRVGTTQIGANEATQIGLGYVHNLSKRSALYATVSRLSNDGALTLAIPGGNAGMAAGGSSKGYEAGLRHSF
jgi:predicted porin